MAHVPQMSYQQGFHVVPHQELSQAPRAPVRLGPAPDGLPWILDVDRSARLQTLFSAVVSAFELQSRAELPPRVRQALERDVAAGLMGIHQVELRAGAGSAEVYVSRRTTHELLGQSLLSRLLEGGPSSPMDEPPQHLEASTNASAVNFDALKHFQALEAAIRHREATRRLLLTLKEGGAWVGTVHKEDRPLRTPSGPYRPLIFEALPALEGALARFDADGQSWTAPLSDQTAYQAALLRASQTTYGAGLAFEVPRATALALVVGLARAVGALHRRGLVHADLTPGNVLIQRGQPLAIDSLDIPSGEISAAATFEWAAPEQIVSRPLDPRADVYSLGQMITALVGGVPFGEQTQYVVPTGKLESKTVGILKTEGVFVDILGTDHSRPWQQAWQSFLGRCVAFDRERRPADGGALAEELAALAREHPLTGTLELDPSFGELVRLEDGKSWSFARQLRD